MAAVTTKPTGAGAKVRRQRYYAYQGKDGAVVWMTRKFHVMLLEHPNWMPRFHVLQATGESRLMLGRAGTNSRTRSDRQEMFLELDVKLAPGTGLDRLAIDGQ